MGSVVRAYRWLDGVTWLASVPVRSRSTSEGTLRPAMDQGRCCSLKPVSGPGRMFTRMGSRSFVGPVYFTWPFIVLSSTK